MLMFFVLFYVFFFNDTATTEIYTSCHTLSLHDALPICRPRSTATVCASPRPPEPRPKSPPPRSRSPAPSSPRSGRVARRVPPTPRSPARSEEHTSELQSLMRISYAVFCLKKKTSELQPHMRRTNDCNNVRKINTR